MFSLDPYIIQFVSGNAIAIGLFLMILKFVAKLTPGVWDDKIVTLLGRMFKFVPKEKSDKNSSKS